VLAAHWQYRDVIAVQGQTCEQASRSPDGLTPLYVLRSGSRGGQIRVEQRRYVRNTQITIGKQLVLGQLFEEFTCLIVLLRMS